MLKIKFVSSTSMTIVEDTEAQARELLDLDARMCGFDSEMTVVSAMNEPLLGNDERVIPAIVQLCVKRDGGDAPYSFPLRGIPKDVVYTCYIFPVKALITQGRSMPTSYVQLLRNERFVKASVGMKNDLNMLGRSLGFQIGAPLEIQLLALIAGHTDLGLGALAKALTPLEKAGSAGGNYDGILSEEQLRYAAMDALLCHLIIEKLMETSFISDVVTNTIPLTDNELRAMWSWVKNSSLSNSTTLDVTKVKNQFYNSYTNWKTKYSHNAINDAVKSMLDYAVAQRIITTEDGIKYNSIHSITPKIANSKKRNKITLTNQNDPDELMNAAYTVIFDLHDKNGHTLQGLITILQDSIILVGAKPQIQQRIQSAVDTLVARGKLVLNTTAKRYFLRIEISR